MKKTGAVFLSLLMAFGPAWAAGSDDACRLLREKGNAPRTADEEALARACGLTDQRGGDNSTADGAGSNAGGDGNAAGGSSSMGGAASGAGLSVATTSSAAGLTMVVVGAVAAGAALVGAFGAVKGTTTTVPQH